MNSQIKSFYRRGRWCASASFETPRTGTVVIGTVDGYTLARDFGHSPIPRIVFYLIPFFGWIGYTLAQFSDLCCCTARPIPCANLERAVNWAVLEVDARYNNDSAIRDAEDNIRKMTGEKC